MNKVESEFLALQCFANLRETFACTKRRDGNDDDDVNVNDVHGHRDCKDDFLPAQNARSTVYNTELPLSLSLSLSLSIYLSLKHIYPQAIRLWLTVIHVVDTHTHSLTTKLSLYLPTPRKEFVI